MFLLNVLVVVYGSVCKSALNYSWITFQLNLGQVFMFCRGSRTARLKETNSCFFTASVTGLKLRAWPPWIGWYVIVKARYSGWSEVLDASGGYTLTIKVLGHIDFLSCVEQCMVVFFSLHFLSVDICYRVFCFL